MSHPNQGLNIIVNDLPCGLISGRFSIAHNLLPPSRRGCSFFCAAKELSNADSLLVGTKPFVSARRPKTIGEPCFAWLPEGKTISHSVRHRLNSSAFFRLANLLASAD